MPLEDSHSEKHEGEPIERPLRWSDLWRVFLPLYPWLATALLIYLVVRLIW